MCFEFPFNLIGKSSIVFFNRPVMAQHLNPGTSLVGAQIKDPEFRTMFWDHCACAVTSHNDKI